MSVNCEKIKVNLPNSLESFSFFKKEPFIIFEKNDFLDAGIYKKLVDDVYSLDDFEHVFINQGEKKRTSISGNNLDNLKESTLKNFCCYFLSRDFFDWFKKTHLEHFPRKRFLYFYIRNPKSFIFKLVKRFVRIAKIPIFFFHAEIEYSSIAKGGFIPPHTDYKSKRLSFVLYVPNTNTSSTEEMRKAMGTKFWRVKKQAGNSMDRFHCNLLDGQELELFYDNYECFHASEYKENLMVGFIKSDNSWHSVESFNFEYDRRALVINVFEE